MGANSASTPPRCKTCGVAEFRHLCSGHAPGEYREVKPAPKPTSVPALPPLEFQLGHTVVHTDKAGRVHVGTCVAVASSPKPKRARKPSKPPLVAPSGRVSRGTDSGSIPDSGTKPKGRDNEKFKAYMRDYMRTKRAAAKEAGK